MITNEMFSDEVLKRAAAKLAEAINNSLPQPEECEHSFSEEFEQKMRELIKTTETKCYVVTFKDVMHRE